MRSSVMPLNRVIALSLTAIVMFGAVLFAYSVDDAVTDQITAEIGESTAILANQMDDKLDRGLSGRYREISVAAALLAEPSSNSDGALKNWINHRNASYTDFIWIGLINKQGELLTDVGQPPASVDFLAWDSVQKILRGTAKQESLSSRLNIDVNGTNKSTPSRMIDMAVPVVDARGDVMSIIVATTSWQWAEEIATSLMGSGQVARGTDLFILSDTGEILLGPASVREIPADLGSLRSAKRGAKGFAIETWPGDRKYVTGYARSDGHAGSSGFGWTILVRQNADLALAPVEKDRKSVV